MFNVLLADIGNTYFHIYDGTKIVHLKYSDAIERYKDERIFYISVKHELSDEIENIKKWKNVSSLMQIEGAYDTMGIDRKALCLSHHNGLFVDAGSAITVDVVKEGKYMGGFILPGLKAYIQAYKMISPALDTSLKQELRLENLATTTKEQISYGIIASIKALIDKHSDGKKLYFTGGDGEFLSSFFKDANYDEMLVFYGMQKAINNKG